MDSNSLRARRCGVTVPDPQADLATLREYTECPNQDAPFHTRAGCSYCGTVGPAVDALTRVEAELSRLREERDEAQGLAAIWQDSSGAYCERMVAAEARCARLQQALAHALDCKGSFNGTVSERGGDPAICTKCEAEAREALAGPDTPADSKEGE